MKEWLKYWYSEYRHLRFFPRKGIQIIICGVVMTLIYVILKLTGYK